MSEIDPHNPLPLPVIQKQPPAPLAVPTSEYVPHVNKIAPPSNLTDAQKAVEEKIIRNLREIFDPEIPVNIYDMGLIYDIEFLPENKVHVRMTLTAPGCPVAGVLPGQVESAVENVPEVADATVELVWEPTWSKDMLSDAARLALGFM